MKELITKETKEVFEGVCGLCGKRFQGSTKNEVIYNLGAHRNSKACKSAKLVKDVQDGLPPRTPGYVSPKSKNTRAEDE